MKQVKYINKQYNIITSVIKDTSNIPVTNISKVSLEERIIYHIVLKDMIYNLTTWRHIRGYPTSGATTYTNAKSSRKNKLLLNFRIQQFQKLFGEKKRNIFPTLVKAEYNNRLWFYNWFSEWFQASRFVDNALSSKNKTLNFNPALLAQNQTNGYTRVGKAAKIGKAKKLTKVFTIGVPLFFSRYIYMEKLPAGFIHKLIIRDEVNKKLGKKSKKK